MIILIITTTIIFLTELTSNLATVAAFLPIVASVAIKMGVDPLDFVIPATIAASCAFMLPVGTPPNAIIYATEKITITEMVKSGFWLNILATILIVLAVYFYLPAMMNIDLTSFPSDFLNKQ